MLPPLVGLGAPSDRVGFDLLVIAHVACALVGFGALVTSGVQAARLGRSAPGPAPAGLQRYFAPGVNWAGRALYGVPVFGFALLADSGGRMDLADGWVLAGLVLWALSGLLAEGFLWPAERRLQAALVRVAPDGSPRPLAAARRDCRVVTVLGSVLAALFVAATVVMVAKPG